MLLWGFVAAWVGIRVCLDVRVSPWATRSMSTRRNSCYWMPPVS